MIGVGRMLHEGGKPTRVIAVTSGKGGVGKTTVSINLAVGLSELGCTTMLLDADLGLANVDVLLGLSPQLTLKDVVAGHCTLADIVIEEASGVHIIPSASGIQEMAALSDFEHLGLMSAFGQLEAQLDYLIVDTAAGIASNTLHFCDASQEVLVVICDDPASVTDAYAIIKLLHQRSGRNRFRVLINMARDAAAALRLYAKLLEVADRYLEVSLDLVGQIPFDPNNAKAVKRRRPLISEFPSTAAAAEFKKLAHRADKWPIPRCASGRMEFFVERLVHSEPAGRAAQQ